MLLSDSLISQVAEVVDAEGEDAAVEEEDVEVDIFVKKGGCNAPHNCSQRSVKVQFLSRILPISVLITGRHEFCPQLMHR